MLFPFAFNCTLILSKRFPSWLLLSFHTFSTLYDIFSISCVFVITVFPVVSVLYDTVYPSGTTSSTEYVISFPLSYFGRSVHVFLQLFSAFSFARSPKLCPFAFSCTCTSLGRLPSWFSPSFHTFSTLYVVFSVSYVFVIIVFPFELVLYDAAYPSGTTSSTVYVISFPFSYFGKFVHVFFQLLLELNAITSPLLLPFAFNCTCILVGRFPSWLLLSFHTFSTLYVVSSIWWVFVIIVFPSVLVLYDSV